MTDANVFESERSSSVRGAIDLDVDRSSSTNMNLQIVLMVPRIALNMKHVCWLTRNIFQRRPATRAVVSRDNGGDWQSGRHIHCRGDPGRSAIDRFLTSYPTRADDAVLLSNTRTISSSIRSPFFRSVHSYARRGVFHFVQL